MLEKPVPSLSESGWIFSSSIGADILFAHFLSSQASQTNLYVGSVASLVDIIQRNTQDPLKTSSELETALRDYFGRYYNSVDVQVTWGDETPDSSKVELKIFLELVDKEGNSINLVRALEVTDSKSVKVIERNNGFRGNG